MKKLLLLIGIFISLYSFSQESLKWRGENRDGKYSDTGLLKSWPENGPKLLWHYDELGPGHGSATVTKDKVFASGTTDINGYIIAFDHSGKVLWKTEFGKEWLDSYDGVRATPMYDNGKLYIISSYGVITCLNSEDGKIVWQVDGLDKFQGRNIKWGITENLVIDGDNLYCTLGGVETHVIALNKNTGDLVWKSAGKGEISAYCSQIISHMEDNVF